MLLKCIASKFRKFGAKLQHAVSYPDYSIDIIY